MPRSSDVAKRGRVGQVGLVGQDSKNGQEGRDRLHGRAPRPQSLARPRPHVYPSAAYQRNATPMFARQKLRPDVSSSVMRTAGVFSVVASDEFVAL
jgi:hypothetical protein